MRRWFDLMLANQDDLAILMTAEQGKPLAESKGEIAYARPSSSGSRKRASGSTATSFPVIRRISGSWFSANRSASSRPSRHGIFPSAMITRKAGPALAAGCTMVCKPATQTPYSALALAELADRAGIPKGVFNVITGSSTAIGAEMTGNPTVRKVTFTGFDGSGQETDGCNAPEPSRSCRWNWAEMLHSSCSTTPIWMPPFRAPSPASTEQHRSNLRVRKPAAGAGRRVP